MNQLLTITDTAQVRHLRQYEPNLLETPRW